MLDEMIRPAGLDASAFRSLRMARREDEAIWTRDWVCVGTTHELAGVGDLLPFTAGDHAIHIQRMAGDVLAGRFNKAQHGGCRVVPVQCQQGTKTPCSFTSCGHSRDRPIIAASELGDATPEMHQYLGLRPERLLPVRVGRIGPLLCVNLDPHGEPITDTARSVQTAVPALSRQDMPLQGSHWQEVDGNWKLVAQRLLAAEQLPRAFGASVLVADTTLVGLPARALWLFPNLVLLALQHVVCAVVLQPVALTRTLCRITVLGDDALPPADWLALIGERLSDVAPDAPTRADDAVASWLAGEMTHRLERNRLDTLDLATNP
ncbi:hypothetical protein [Methyloversatilis sp.]|uniref:hypothetical protein n=1 Tax=Methyloversatilis sp. TaxID=2569862 RepID=UPI002735ECC4|nr:hypothetical protein [Methyloversatilis sp.]MDP2868959.1 hypothetical protein [Methyloversatilis sp.]MDP3454610.1 hypothetical protein [Methyloversatilis sp.]MDP3580180.1 hypothetical protein [Methyloversatilis sp.]